VIFVSLELSNNFFFGRYTSVDAILVERLRSLLPGYFCAADWGNSLDVCVLAFASIADSCLLTNQVKESWYTEMMINKAAKYLPVALIGKFRCFF